jgi:transcriptional regulator with XRE-family HTH domain
MPGVDALAQLVGNRIREARLRADLTQAGLAEKVGVEPQTVSAFERGTRLPRLSTLQRIAECTGVRLTALVELDAERAERDDEVPPELRPLVELMRGRPLPDIDRITRAVEALLATE